MDQSPFKTYDDIIKRLSDQLWESQRREFKLFLVILWLLTVPTFAALLIILRH